MATNPTATSFTNTDGAHMWCDGAGKFAQNQDFLQSVPVSILS